MPALALQLSQMLLLQLCSGDCLRPHHLTKFAQQLCIDSIGLGQNPSRSRKLPYPVGLHQTDFDSCPPSPCTNARWYPPLDSQITCTGALSCLTHLISSR